MKAGLEVHQQLATGKLFCRCPCEFSEHPLGTFTRRLEAAGGEELAIDRAASFQAARELLYRYEVVPPSCLVEMDEEPPRPINPAALECALLVAHMLNARVVDEIEVMRKIVVDGSNTAGFQRTSLIAVDGTLELRGKRYPIESICLEEDAARKVSESSGEVTYRLDRLGIPLLEFATGPAIESGTEAREVAEELGALVRATGRVRRGIGSIREDVNVSIEGGHRVEIKGVQELRLIAAYVEGEARRQAMLLEVRSALHSRRVRPISNPPVDLSELFSKVSSGPLAHRSGAPRVVLALALPGFGGLLHPPGHGEERLGRELADHARTAGLKGLLHSDELPGYGLTEEDVEGVRKALSLGPEDAFVLVTDASRERATAAHTAVTERANAALEGVPGETRDPPPAGRTRYSRPISGRHRMYPETDVPPIRVPLEDLARLERQVPELPAAVRARLEREFSLPADLVRQIVSAGEVSRLEDLIRRGHPSTLVARLLTQDLPQVLAQEPAGQEPDLPTLDQLLQASRSGTFAKEGIPAVLTELVRGAPTVEVAVERAGLAGMSGEELRSVVRSIVQENRDLIRRRGEEAFSALMGDVMKKARGRFDGEAVARELNRELAQALASERKR